MAIYIDDQELVAAHRAGDSEAFDELVREHRASLYSHARRKLNCDSGAEDALQETLVRAYRALPKFNGEYRLGPWLHRIMANVCIDEANRRRRDGDKTERLAAQPSSRSHIPGIEDQLGLQLDDGQLKAALDDLPATQREALTLRFVDELDYQQVAEVSGVSEQNARARVSRARTAMRTALKGVAALPVLLISVMRRGEKAAAAASAGSTATAAGATVSSASSVSSMLPAITEASVAVTQVAPAAVPVVAKAAVGIGLAAAVFTPTSDSAVHLAAEALVSAPAVVQDETYSMSVLSDDTADQPEVLTSETSVEQLSDNSNPTIQLETVSPAASQPIVVPGPASSEEITVDQPAQIATTGTEGTLSTFNFVAQSSAEGQYDLSGEARFVVGGVTFVGQIDPISRIRVEGSQEAQGSQRLEALVVVSGEGGEPLTEMRLAGFVDSDTVGGAAIKGLFVSDNQDLNLLSRGTFVGTIKLGSLTEPGSLNIQFIR